MMRLIFGVMICQDDLQDRNFYSRFVPAFLYQSAIFWIGGIILNRRLSVSDQSCSRSIRVLVS